MTDLFTTDWRSVGRAIVSAVFVAILVYLGNTTALTAIDPKQILNIAVITALASLCKQFTSDSSGKFGGVL